MNMKQSVLLWLAVIALACLAGCSSEGDPIAPAPTPDLNTLDTQEKVDAFGALRHTDYPDRLVIGVEDQPNSSITNLGALNSLTSVKGLVIHFNDGLVDLSGIHNLTTIGPDGLVIESNPNLKDLTELSQVGSIDGHVAISRNDELESIRGLGSLDVIGGDLTIEGNPRLPETDGFANLSMVHGDLIIGKNEILGRTSGFHSLRTIQGSFIIEENPKLAEILPMNRLESVLGDMVIRMNNVLGNPGYVLGVSEIGGNLAIDKNPKLLGLRIFSNVKSISGTVVITKNAELTNITGLRDLSTLDGGLIFLDNPNLGDFCGLQTLLSNGYNGTFAAVRNALNPTMADIRAGNCN